MKRISMFTGILLIAGVLATMAFSHPLVVRNGVVRSYTANSVLTLQSKGLVQIYMLRQGMSILPQNGANTLGAGARVTVIAQCFRDGATNNGFEAKASKTSRANANNNNNNGNQNNRVANEHLCVALAVVVRGPAAGAVPATGGTGTTSGTATPSTGSTGATTATGTPSASGVTGAATATGTPGTMGVGTATGTPGTMGVGTATGTPGTTGVMMTPMVCPPAGTGTPTATPTTGPGTPTAMPCVTPTSTP